MANYYHHNDEAIRVSYADNSHVCLSCLREYMKEHDVHRGVALRKLEGSLVGEKIVIVKRSGFEDCYCVKHIKEILLDIL